MESPEGVRAALKNGVDTIEHGAKPDEEILSLFKEKNAALICTLSPALPYTMFDPSVSHCGETGKKNGSIVFQGIIDCAKACLANGIPVGLGTDSGCPFITHYDMWRELVYFTRYCDVTPDFALYTATHKNAEILGILDKTGTLEEGKLADFIVTEENPLKDLRTLRKLYLVSAKGKIVKEPRIKKNKVCERELDKYLPWE